MCPNTVPTGNNFNITGKDMKYFTKEWYNDTLVAQMCFQLRKNESAGVFSEKFFNKLYALEKKTYIKFRKKTAKFERKPIDLQAFEAEFDESYNQNFSFVEKNLPEEILNDVKDIRVLALGSATYEIAGRITRHCGQITNRCEAVKRKYEEASDLAAERMGGRIPPLFAELVGLPIDSVTQNDDCVTVITSDKHGDAPNKVTLKNATVTHIDNGVSGSLVCNYELIAADNEKIEFSMLLMSDDSTLAELTVIADSVEIEKI